MQNKDKRNSLISDGLYLFVIATAFLLLLLLTVVTEASAGPVVFTKGEIVGKAITVDYPHHETHAGNHFQVSIMNTLGSGAIVNTLMITPSANFSHMLLRLDAQSETSVDFYRTPTCSSNGTLQTSTNMNDISSNTAATVIYVNPVCASNGTLLNGWSQRLGSGQQTGGETRSANEHVLRPSTVYLVQVTSLAANNDIDNVFDWYEDSGDAP